MDSALQTTSENGCHRLRELERMQKAVKARLHKEYELNEKAFTIPEQWQQKVNDAISAQFSNSQKWATISAQALNENPLLTREFLEEKATTIIKRYTDGFYTRWQVGTATATSEPYSRDVMRRTLADIYINHLTNQAETECDNLGLSPITAHRLNGTCIMLATIAYYLSMPREQNTLMHQSKPEAVNFVNPMIGPIPYHEPLDARRTMVKNYWRDRAEEAENEWHRSMSSRS